jgi:hypothetical protein
LPSDFEQIHKRGHSFGISREAYTKVYVKDNPVSDKAVPGPGSYEVREIPGKEARKFSFKLRKDISCN